MSGRTLKFDQKHPAWAKGTVPMQAFKPTLDLEAKKHKKFDDLMNDTKEKKAKSKVTLPKLRFLTQKD